MTSRARIQEMEADLRRGGRAQMEALHDLQDQHPDRETVPDARGAYYTALVMLAAQHGIAIRRECKLGRDATPAY